MCGLPKSIQPVSLTLMPWMVIKRKTYNCIVNVFLLIMLIRWKLRKIGEKCNDVEVQSLCHKYAEFQTCIF